MKRGFYTIMSAQFFSSLADNALFVAAVQLLRSNGAPEWQRRPGAHVRAVLRAAGAFVGAFADALPKGRVMLISNAIKVLGCLMMLFGFASAAGLRRGGPGRGGVFPGQIQHPHRAAAGLAAGQGQRLDRGPDHRLHHPRRAAGRAAGGPHRLGALLLDFDLPGSTPGIDTAARGRDPDVIPVRAAALFNLRIPHTGAAMRPMPRQSSWRCCAISGLQPAAVARQAGPDLAGHHHAVLGAFRATCATSSWPGPPTALGYGDAGLGAGQRGCHRHGSGGGMGLAAHAPEQGHAP